MALTSDARAATGDAHASPVTRADVALGWSLLAQVLSSATTYLLSLLVLRAGDLATFGWFTLTFFAYLLGLNVVRAVAGTPLLLSAPTLDAARGACGMAAAVGSALAVCGLPLVLLLPGPLRHMGLLVCLALPFALLQDVQRCASFARRRPIHAALLNAVWLVVMMGAVLATDVGPVAAWAAGAAAGTVVGAGLLRLYPSPSQVRHFLHGTRYWRNGLLAEAASNVVILQASPFLVALVIGIGAFGALRAAYTVLAPVGMLIAGVAPVLLVTYQRLARTRPAALRRAARVNATNLAGVAACYLAVVWLVPEPVLVLGFGPAVRGVLGLVVPIGLTLVLFAAFCTLVDALRGVVRPRRIAVLRTCAAGSELACTLVGGLIGGAEGAAFGGIPGVLAPLLVAGWMVWRSDPNLGHTS
ncbi:MAG: hypothetical protein ACT4RN_21595 [Pseudonocardia sp.]